MLCRLLYVSRLSDAGASRITSTMQDILIVSALRNREDAITGFLLGDGERFVQVLEGPDLRVTACYERILKDARHEDVRLRLLVGIDERRFSRWSMCGLYLSDLDDTVLSPPDIGFDVGGAGAGALLQHLEGVALRHAHRLDALHERLIAAS
ncbi:BLUF domain-containing protein [Phenylobacterium sp.]|uniref:BLUF domain-containing protein n=1 Tax=Phenylobacterium sp. TaxID=1871053 RepID=UPI0025EBB5C3|nr:BLUF domain-containing protein [Phenylobacterium sp.]